MAPSGREREKKDDQQQKTFFGEKEKKLEVIPKKRDEGKKTISGFCSKARKKFGTYKKVEIDFLQNPKLTTSCKFYAMKM